MNCDDLCFRSTHCGLKIYMGGVGTPCSSFLSYEDAKKLNTKENDESTNSN